MTAQNNQAQARLPAQPGQWLGMLGGGQLGRMFTMAAQSMGFKVCVLDPDIDSPAGVVADMHLTDKYSTDHALRQLGELCVAVTTEFENVPAQALEMLSTLTHISPSATAVAIAQNRIKEKQFISKCGVPVAPHLAITQLSDITEAAVEPLLPGILKTTCLGYDGKGQVKVDTFDDVLSAFICFAEVPCVLEQRLKLKQELSVIVARGLDGQTSTFPVAENEHTKGILATTIVPARIAEDIQTRAKRAATAIAEHLDYVGVLCVEFFLLQNDELIVNELAPRPHNSGHYTMNACDTSQFEQQARIAAGLPLGGPRLHSAAVMVNLLGDIWFDPASENSLFEDMKEPNWSAVLAIPEVRLHLYGKSQARRDRKMGHINCVADSLDKAMLAAKQVRNILGIVT
jgi:5-(carboxyamino)imidazole ribonucleotide synthase